MVVDTDILIDYLRKRAEAVAFIESEVDRIYLSTVSVAELYQGVRSEIEITTLNTFTDAFPVLDLTHAIAREAGLFRKQYRPSHGCGLADCMIAATAVQKGMPLATLNLKHYPMVESAFSPYSK